jgi:hypothetical protein
MVYIQNLWHSQVQGERFFAPTDIIIDRFSFSEEWVFIPGARAVLLSETCCAPGLRFGIRNPKLKPWPMDFMWSQLTITHTRRICVETQTGRKIFRPYIIATKYFQIFIIDVWGKAFRPYQFQINHWYIGTFSHSQIPQSIF